MIFPFNNTWTPMKTKVVNMPEIRIPLFKSATLHRFIYFVDNSNNRKFVMCFSANIVFRSFKSFYILFKEVLLTGACCVCVWGGGGVRAPIPPPYSTPLSTIVLVYIHLHTGMITCYLNEVCTMCN